MNDNRSNDLNSWHTNFTTTTDDIQEFMKTTYYMMGVVDKFMRISDASTYGGFRDDGLVMFRKMHKEMHNIIERRKMYIDEQNASLAV